MAKRLWGPFSIPGEREVGAGRGGSGIQWFLVAKMSTGDVRGGERGAAIYNGLLSSVKSWTVVPIASYWYLSDVRKNGLAQTGTSMTVQSPSKSQ